MNFSKKIALNVTFKSTLIIAKIFGLVPFNFDHKNNQAKLTRHSTFHCLIVVVLILVLYPICVSTTLSMLDKTGSEIIIVAEQLEYYLGFILMTSMFSVQLYYRKELVLLINSFVDLFRKLESFQSIWNFKRILKFYIIKAYIFGLISIIFNWINLNSFIKNYTFIFLLQSSITIIPTIIFTIISNIFYGSMLLISFALIILNDNLHKYVQKINARDELIDNIGDTSKINRKICDNHIQLDLSDKFDYCAEIHNKISNLCDLTNKINSFNLLLIITHGFANVVIQLFYIYITVFNSVGRHKKFDFFLAIEAAISALIGFIEIFFIVDVLSTVTALIQRTIDIIHSVTVVEMDIRLDRSVNLLYFRMTQFIESFYFQIELLSIQLLQRKIEMKPCGFFIVDYTLLHSVLEKLFIPFLFFFIHMKMI